LLAAKTCKFNWGSRCQSGSPLLAREREEICTSYHLVVEANMKYPSRL
jgi:hypothetical protein